MRKDLLLDLTKWQPESGTERGRSGVVAVSKNQDDKRQLQIPLNNRANDNCKYLLMIE